MCIYKELNEKASFKSFKKFLLLKSGFHLHIPISSACIFKEPLLYNILLQKKYQHHQIHAIKRNILLRNTMI